MNTNTASADGRFLIEVRDYKTGKELGYLLIDNLEPHAPLQCEVIEGDDEE